MKEALRIKEGRSEWKRKAVERGTAVRELKKAQKRKDRRTEQREADLLARIRVLERENASLHAAPVRMPRGVVTLHDAAAIRVLCVMMVIHAVISFRAVPRCLEIVQPSASWIPHFTSVINWTFRVGLALLQSIAPEAEPWIAVIDMSIDIAIKKVFVVLRVPITALALRGSALTLEDCEVVGLKVSESWKGEDVCEVLEEVFKKSGQPAAILKDGGKDLKRGVELYRETVEGASGIHIIEDVGHVAANALKAEFAGLKAFKDFLKTITKGAAKIRQSKLAFLTPPKLRTKGRFMSISRLAVWAEKVTPLIGGSGRVAGGSLAADLRRLLGGGLSQHSSFLERFVPACKIVRNVVAIAKNNGVNQASYREMRDELGQLSQGNKIRVRLERWLNRQLYIQSRFKMGQTPLLVSSDVLESLFGKFKVVVARNVKAEFNQNVLTIPALCGKLTADRINQALAAVTQRELERWTAEHVKDTQWQRRTAFNRGELKQQTVPKPGNGK